MVQSILILGARSLFDEMFTDLLLSAKRWMLSDDEFESLYDWCVTEALMVVLYQKTAQNVTVNGHYRHDIFRCVFDEVKPKLINSVRNLLTNSGITINIARTIKVMITYHEIIIVHKPFTY